MADPQANTTTNQTRAKDANANASGAAEPRSFEQTKSEPRSRAHDEGGRELAEQSRRAGRQLAEGWRQAVDPLLTMQYDMSQWFDEVFRNTFGFRAAPTAFRPMGHLTPAGLFGLPAAELKETESAHLLAIELPGLTREDVDLSIQGDTLVVSGHKAEESEDATESYRVSERRYGRFERAFPLSPDVERGRIEAEFRDGVLRITLPKAADAKPQRAKIDIKG